ncbi:MAG: DUF4372 domain-containing protein [Pseudomonadota bacterium]
MNSGQTVFSQLIDHLSLHSFHTCVRRYKGNHRARTLTCLDLFLAFSFAQLTYRESLRDIVACLNASPEKLYHMGIRGRISRSTLSDANEKRDWRIYQDMALVLIATAQKLLAEQNWGRNQSCSARPLLSNPLAKSSCFWIEIKACLDLKLNEMGYFWAWLCAASWGSNEGAVT